MASSMAGEIALSEIGLVLFDFDGVIVDSEAIALEELAAEMTLRGAPVSYEETRDLFLGRSTSAHMAFISERSGRPCADDFPDIWHGRLFRRYRSELEIVPGVLETLNFLEANDIACCIASGGSVERIAFALSCAGLTERFEGRAFSAEMVERGKPAPDLFLHAAATFGVRPDACLVIEDASSGITAAEAAGMASIGFVGGRHLADCREEHASRLVEVGAAAVARSHLDLRRLIGRGKPRLL